MITPVISFKKKKKKGLRTMIELLPKELGFLIIRVAWIAMQFEWFIKSKLRDSPAPRKRTPVSWKVKGKIVLALEQFCLKTIFPFIFQLTGFSWSHSLALSSLRCNIHLFGTWAWPPRCKYAIRALQSLEN
jgi:hypothetical protein